MLKFASIAPKEAKKANLPDYLKASSAAVGLPLLSKAPLS